MVQGSEDVLFGKIQKNHWMAVEVWIFIHLAFFWGGKQKIRDKFDSGLGKKKKKSINSHYWYKLQIQSLKIKKINVGIS